MRTVKMMGPAALILGLVAAAPGAAQAKQYNASFNGNLCESYSPDIKHSIYGVYNNSATTDYPVYCPIAINYEITPPIALPTAQSYSFGGYDRNDTPGIDIKCNVKSTLNSNGAISTHGLPMVSNTGGPLSAYQLRGDLLPYFPLDNRVTFLECTLPRTQFGNLSYLQMYTFQYTQ